MGEVWAARNQSTEREVALKFIAASVPATARMKARLLREARAAGRVKHESVVEVFDVLETASGVPVIVMELLEGETLAEHIAEHGALAVPEMANIMAQVVSAVGKAHERGVVHRDLKPSNIMLLDASRNSLPRVKVLDFGIAKMVGARGGDLTTIGHCVGTPAYMAPEQCRADPGVDHRADMWAIGVMVYELLAGARPIPGNSIGEVVEFVVTEGIPPLRMLVPDAPFDLAIGTRRLLERDPDLRPSGLHEMANLLIGYTDREAPEFGDAHAAELPVLLDVPLPEARASAPRQSVAPLGRGRRGAVAGAVVVVAVLVAAGLSGPGPSPRRLNASFQVAASHAADVVAKSGDDSVDEAASEGEAPEPEDADAGDAEPDRPPADESQPEPASSPATPRPKPMLQHRPAPSPAASSTSEAEAGEGGSSPTRMRALPWEKTKNSGLAKPPPPPTSATGR
jgi:eukaryotic-like serine/threonine-protein kinase